MVLLLASFFSIGLLNLVNNLRPYLFEVVLGIPDAERGRLAGRLDVIAELPTLLLSTLIGVWADRIGRRVLYAGGFACLALGFSIFPLVQPNATLFIPVLLCAAGAAAIGTMLATVIADYPTERARGRLVGACFFLNGIGIATMIGVPAKVPAALEPAAGDPQIALRWTYWLVAGLCVIPLLATAFGLAPWRRSASNEPGEARPPPLPFTQRLLIGLRAARDPQVRLAYASAMVTRAALSIVSGFFFLWMVEAGKAQGMTVNQSYAASGGVLVTVQIVATFWAALVITFIDRLDRILALALGTALTAIGYTLFGLQDNPFQPAMYAFAVMMGIGEMSGILTSQALIGKVAPAESRGAVVGVFTLCGGLGILMSATLGGWLFDHWRPSAPYILMGAASGLLCCYALWVWRGMRREQSA
jgi:MFS family permease